MSRAIEREHVTRPRREAELVTESFCSELSLGVVMSTAVVSMIQPAAACDPNEMLYRQMARQFRAYKAAVSKGEEVPPPAYDEATLCRFWDWQRRWLADWVSKL